MARIFLSYSALDAASVEKLAADLRRAKHFVWLAKTEIQAGEEISLRLEDGLRSCSHIAVWLTRRAIESRWVEREWRSALYRQLGTGGVVVVPLLAEPVELPDFLSPLKFVDFRGPYEYGLRELLRFLPIDAEKEETISAFAVELLRDLGSARIPFPFHGPIPIVSTLRRLPRSGKKVRLYHYRHGVRVRSVYDHILSVAHSADCLFSVVSHGLKPMEREDLARCVVYHDLAEVLLGDVPAYTNLTTWRKHKSRLFAEENLRELDPGVPKQRANAFLEMFLDKRERECLRAAQEVLSDETNRIKRFFYVLDKLDPIIAVWRYLHVYRGKLDPGAKVFVFQMKDFFANPDVMRIAKDYDGDKEISGLVHLLQDRKLARRYYDDATSLLAKLDLFTFPIEVVQRLIEGRRFAFPEDRPRRR